MHTHLLALRPWLTAVLICATSLGGAVASAQTRDLTELSLEDLLTIEVTSVSRKTETLLRTAAAVYVIDAEDIRRSGARSLPDVFRMVPGVSVAQMNANNWSVTARGFGGGNANKLLVLIDGRSVQAPLNNSVNWELQVLPLDAIEQIEVIRGPGGSLWGTNAINGVINVVTKRAYKSQGIRVSVGADRYQPGAADVSYGGTLGASGHHVTRARYQQRRASGLTAGLSGGDDLDTFYAGSRLDFTRGADEFTVQFDVQRGNGSRVTSEPRLAPPYVETFRADVWTRGGNAVLSWRRTSASGVENSAQVYYSGFSHDEVSETSHVADADVRHRRRLGSRHDVVAGAGYRSSFTSVAPSRMISISPPREHEPLVTAFLHDEVTLTDRVSVSAGAKLTHGVTGFEVQPSVRSVWMISPNRSLWGAVSRTVRTPNRGGRGIYVLASAGPGPLGLPQALTLSGSQELTSEHLTEYEMGYRVQRGSLSVDATTFVGAYDDLNTSAIGAPRVAEVFGVRAFEIPLKALNGATATSRGAEIATTWRPVRAVELAGSYSFIDLDFTNGANQVAVNGPVPQHQLHMRTFVDLGRGIDAGALFYRVSEVQGTRIPAYNRLDLRAAWSGGQGLTLAAGVQNLLHDEQIEYVEQISRSLPAPIRASLYVEAGWTFGR